MSIILQKAFTFMFFVSIGYSAHATHVMGSDIQWTCLGNDSFKVEVSVYRDCNGIALGNTLIDFGGKCKGIKTRNQAIGAGYDITPTCAGQCTRCLGRGCTFQYGIQKFTLSTVIDLSIFRRKGCCLVNISWGQCCRNGAVTNLKGNSDKNYRVEAEMNVCQSPCDNSPQFNVSPMALVCLGRNVILSQKAVDPDRDSLGRSLDSHYYRFAQPLEGRNMPIAYKKPFTYQKPLNYLGFPSVYKPKKFPFGFHLDSKYGGFYVSSHEIGTNHFGHRNHNLSKGAIYFKNTARYANHCDKMPG